MFYDLVKPSFSRNNVYDIAMRGQGGKANPLFGPRTALAAAKAIGLKEQETAKAKRDQELKVIFDKIDILGIDFEEMQKGSIEVDFGEEVVVRVNGTQRIFNHQGKYHSKDKPSYHNEHEEYWELNGELHRDNLPAVFVSKHKPRTLSREEIDLPLVDSYEYHVHGKLHRTDGPALISKSGKRFFLHGQEFKSFRQLKKHLKNS